MFCCHLVECHSNDHLAEFHSAEYHSAESHGAEIRGLLFYLNAPCLSSNKGPMSKLNLIALSQTKIAN